MSFSVPSLSDLRKIARDSLASKLKLGALLPNSRARFIADANSGLVHLCIKYISWLSEQIFPDKAEDEWLRERHAKIWLGGAKAATFSSGSIRVFGANGALIPERSRIALSSTGSQTRSYETTQMAYATAEGTIVPVVALEPGAASNLLPGAEISFTSTPADVETTAIVVSLEGGTDAEDTEDLRTRVLQRIRNPPMGGDAQDYVKWMLDLPGVTRAWCAPLEMGIGTVTVRFMMDDLRSDGIPLEKDIALFKDIVDQERPVAVKDFFLVAPQLFPISFTVHRLYPDTPAVRAALEKNVRAMINDRAAPASSKNGVLQPAQTIYRMWIAGAIMETDGLESFDLSCEDFVMPHNGALACLGTVSYTLGT